MHSTRFETLANALTARRDIVRLLAALSLGAPLTSLLRREATQADGSGAIVGGGGGRRRRKGRDRHDPGQHKDEKAIRICVCADGNPATCKSQKQDNAKANTTLRRNPCAYRGRCRGVSGCATQPPGPADAQPPPPRDTHLDSTLTGAAEVPGPGDPDGSGTASFELFPDQQQICWELEVSNITLPATGAHIHRGTATEAGPIVVGLIPPDTTGRSSGCVSAAPELIEAILSNPEQYYVNVHTGDYPGGAVRGQLR